MDVILLSKASLPPGLLIPSLLRGIFKDFCSRTHFSPSLYCIIPICMQTYYNTVYLKNTYTFCNPISPLISLIPFNRKTL